MKAGHSKGAQTLLPRLLEVAGSTSARVLLPTVIKSRHGVHTCRAAASGSTLELSSSRPGGMFCAADKDSGAGWVSGHAVAIKQGWHNRRHAPGQRWRIENGGSMPCSHPDLTAPTHLLEPRMRHDAWHGDALARVLH